MKTPSEVWDGLTYKQRLAATAVVFKYIYAQIREGGTYRYLIYNRLGFNEDAYCVLFPEGLDISNAVHELREDHSKFDPICRKCGDPLTTKDESEFCECEHPLPATRTTIGVCIICDKRIEEGI